MSDISKLEPKSVWEAFGQLNSVPRPSKREDKVQKFAVEIGKSLNLLTENK